MSTPRHDLWRSARHVLPMAVALAGVCWLGGCSSSSRDANRLPSLREIRREQRIPPEIAHTLQTEQVRRTPLRVERADFSLHDSLDKAWAMLDTSGLSPAISGAWRVNGIRVGVLKAGGAPVFANELPQAIGGKAQIVVPDAGPMPLLRSPGLHQPVAVDLTVPPRPVREVIISAGGNRRIQLLVEVVYDAMNRPILVFTPHQFVPQQSFEARTAEQKQLDGRMLHELSLAVLLNTGEALVLGVDIPPAPLLLPKPPGVTYPPRRNDPPSEPGLQQAKQLSAPAPDAPSPDGPIVVPPEEVEPADEPAPAEDRLGPNLGRALFAASRYGQPIQMIYIIRMAN